MKKIFTLLLIFFCSIYSFAQKTQPTKQETFEYLRGKLLSLSTHDGINGVTDVKFDENACVLQIFFENGKWNEIFINNLDANSIAWDIYDPNLDPDRPNKNIVYDKLIRITIASINSSSIARNSYNSLSSITPDNGNKNYARLFFDISKAADIPNFQDKITKAVKRLIVLCGGKKEEKDPFGN